MVPALVIRWSGVSIECLDLYDLSTREVTISDRYRVIIRECWSVEIPLNHHQYLTSGNLQKLEIYDMTSFDKDLIISAVEISQ